MFWLRRNAYQATMVSTDPLTQPPNVNALVLHRSCGGVQRVVPPVLRGAQCGWPLFVGALPGPCLLCLLRMLRALSAPA